MLSKLINKGQEAENCEICKTEFNILKLERIHKCKRCNKLVCGKCSGNKHKIIDEEGNWEADLHKVCEHCNDELTQISKLIKQKHICWGKDSKVQVEWLYKMQQSLKSKRKNKKDFEYAHFLNLFNTNLKHYHSDADIIAKDVIKGRTDYVVFGYSMKQFFYRLQQVNIKYDRNGTRTNIANVLYAIAAKFDNIGYIQGMSSIAAYLLCFSSEQTAFVIFSDILQSILPKNLLQNGKNGVNLQGLMAENHFFKEYIVHILMKVKMPLISHSRQPYTQQQIQQMQIIVELSSSKALLSLFVTFLSYQNLIFVWKELSEKRSFQVLQKAFLATMYLARDTIVQRQKLKIIESLFEKIRHQEFIEAYYDIQIDPEIKKKIMDQYEEAQTKKWKQTVQRNVSKLSFGTSLAPEEVSELHLKLKPKQEADGFINRQDFVLFAQIYYEIMKQNSQTEAPILQITEPFLVKIYDSFVEKNMSNTELPTLIKKTSSQKQRSQSQIKTRHLNFKQFLNCLSIVTKSQLKAKVFELLKTYKDKNHKISYFSFEKIISKLCEMAPPQMNKKKKDFLQRRNIFFSGQQDGITQGQIKNLLNDPFIIELSMYIRSDSPGIIHKTIQKYLEVKNKAQ